MPTRREPLEGDSDGYATSCGMNGKPSQRSWPKETTIPPHGDRRRPGAGGGYETNYTATFWKNPLSPHPSLPPPHPLPQPELFELFDEEPGGSRPDRLAPVSGPQEQVQRHTVERMADSALVVPILDAVPLMVKQLVVLRFFDALVLVPELVIDVPKIIFEDQNTQRSTLCEPQLAEQLVEVPTILHFR